MDHVVTFLSLRELRERLSLSQTAMGQRLGMTQSHYSAYERGERKLTELSCRRIVRELSVTARMSPDQSEGFRFAFPVAPVATTVNASKSPSDLQHVEDLTEEQYRALVSHLYRRGDTKARWLGYELGGGVRAMIKQYLSGASSDGVHATLRVVGTGSNAADVAAELSSAADDARYQLRRSKDGGQIAGHAPSRGTATTG